MTTALILVLALAACGRQEQAAQTTQPTIQVRSDGQKSLFAANDLNRAIALKRAIMGSGSTCARVERTGFVSTYKNMDYWTASCVDKFKRARDWAIFIGANDDVQVRLCEDTKAAGLPPCVIKPGTEGKSGMTSETAKS